ncbi:uncharacterized protein [Primulina huaijiensis]|uniref:uncharacterized protein n=1 Tax=Primulina huaijiensis TaxID=1492673 RepID=UPI003CC70DD3
MVGLRWLLMFLVTANPLTLRFPTTLSFVHYREHVIFPSPFTSALPTLPLEVVVHGYHNSYGITTSILASFLTTPLVQSPAPTIQAHESKSSFGCCKWAGKVDIMIVVRWHFLSVACITKTSVDRPYFGQTPP